MKRSWAIFLALSSWGFAATPSLILVNDFRSASDRIELSSKEQTKILARLRKELKLPFCEGGEVRQQITGRLTRDVPQTAYLFYNCQTYAAEPLRGEYGRLAIYQDGKFVIALKNIGDEVKLLPDLDGDGINEILFVTAFGPHMGEFSENASIVNVKSGKLRTLLDIDDAFYDTCSAMVKDASTVAWRIRATLGKLPVVTLDRYEAPCSSDGQISSAYKYQFSKRVRADTPDAK